MTCADCGAAVEHFVLLSYWFRRPLCAACYRVEVLHSAKDNEIRILERMYLRSAA